jgi:hypothetical protein
MRHLICFEGSTDDSGVIGPLGPGSPFLEVVNARDACDIMGCAKTLGTYGLGTYDPVKSPYPWADAVEGLDGKLAPPVPPLLAKELHGKNPTRAQLKAAERAARECGDPIYTHTTIPVKDFYSMSIWLRAALVLDSFARGRCPHGPSLAEFKGPFGFFVGARMGPHGHYGLFDTLLESIGDHPCPFDCHPPQKWLYDAQEDDIVLDGGDSDWYPFLADEGLIRHRRPQDGEGLRQVLGGEFLVCLNSGLEGPGQDDMRKAAQDLADTIFSLYLCGRVQQRNNGHLYSYRKHDLCDKYSELAGLCEGDRIGVCANCGKVFISDKTRGKQRLYCSNSCRVTKWQSMRKEQDNDEGNR